MADDEPVNLTLKLLREMRADMPMFSRPSGQKIFESIGISFNF
jgi:hypothetical protein